MIDIIKLLLTTGSFDELRIQLVIVRVMCVRIEICKPHRFENSCDANTTILQIIQKTDARGIKINC